MGMFWDGGKAGIDFGNSLIKSGRDALDRELYSSSSLDSTAMRHHMRRLQEEAKERADWWEKTHR